MSTQKRIDSSRANGAKSHGPVTPEGRARSRAARLTHGLTSDQLVIASESQQDFDAFREEYLADYHPQTGPQRDLVDQLVATRWRLNRVIALEAALMDIQMARQQPEIDEEFKSCGGDIRAAIAYQHLCDDSRGLESLHRQEARLSAGLHRTFKLLAAEMKTQKFNHEPNAAEAPRPDEDRPAPEAPPSSIHHPPSTTKEPAPSTTSDNHPPSTASLPTSSENDRPPLLLTVIREDRR